MNSNLVTKQGSAVEYGELKYRGVLGCKVKKGACCVQLMGKGACENDRMLQSTKSSGE